jgi:hypothetical protein
LSWAQTEGSAGGEVAGTCARAEKALAAWEIVSIVSSAVIAAWVVPALVTDRRPYILIPVALAFAYMVASAILRRESARTLGLRLDNFWRALRLLLPWMLVAAAFLAVVGWFGGTLNVRRWQGGRDVLGLATLGFEWGLVQQFALQCFVNRRAQEIFGPGWKSVLLVASVFGLLHLPNPALTAATFSAGIVWASVYQRTPNLPALALSHGLMTWALISTAPPDLLNNLRVGYKYFGLLI